MYFFSSVSYFSHRLVANRCIARCGLEAVSESLDSSSLDPFQNKPFSGDYFSSGLNAMERFPPKLDLESFPPVEGFCEPQISLSGNEIGSFDLDEFPEAISFLSDYSPKTHFPVSAITASPVAPLKASCSEAAKIDRRSKTSASSRPSMRTAPYHLDGIRKRGLSTASHTSSPSANPPSSLLCEGDGDLIRATSINSSHSSGDSSISNSVPFSRAITPVLGSSLSQAYGESLLEASRSSYHGRKPSRQESCQAPSNGIDLGGRHFDHYAGPPDLLGSLREEPIVPPAQDMNPDNPDLVPREQEQRFENDLYTPKWVRGQGYKREGWCGICRPGRWLVLKNSAFWYDKSFTHGVSASTGQAFDAPKETRRMVDSPDIWEGLCRRCGEWIPLVSSKKKGTTWFRHAHKVGPVSHQEKQKKERVFLNLDFLLVPNQCSKRIPQEASWKQQQ